MFRREFKKLRKWRVRYDHQSMQSEAGKLLWSKTALKRYTSIEHLWKRKLASLTSPEHWEIFLPRSERSWRADVLYTPKVSIAMGSNKYRPSMLEFCPHCGQRQALSLNLPHERLQLRTNRLTDKLLRRPNIVPCHSAMGQVLDHQVAFHLSGTVPLAPCWQGNQQKQSPEQSCRSDI